MTRKDGGELGEEQQGRLPPDGLMPDDLPPPERDPERLPPLIRPAVEFVARIRATVHAKLLAGFLIIAVLLVMMGIMSILVIREMNQQAQQLILLNEQNDLARQGIYAVTAQSHARAMALITRADSWNDKVEALKANFDTSLDGIAALGGQEAKQSVDRLRAINERFSDAGAEVLALYEDNNVNDALDLHISAEHDISHALEVELNLMIASSEQRIGEAATELASLHRFLIIAVGVFSGVSLLIALGLGAALSWSLIRPVRRVDQALARIAGGDFEERVEVSNRDEFGRLTINLNRTSNHLAKMYKDLSELNKNLEETVDEQLTRLRRA
ncbi:MAG: HAMP domain-containing protein, partial [Actinomycetota bacterium]|nr:HAMP domain-containing protein [Actinomycetota bacterium]